jgi:predicted ATP-grasp superfamily ATP-dependent carboligase
MLPNRETGPPCIVLGLETQIGLGLVRELGRAGVTVIGIAQEPTAIGLASRYLARGVVVTKPRSAELIATIRALGEELGACCLIAVSEVNLSWLEANRSHFGRVQPITPTSAAMAMVLDKQRTLQAAHVVGIMTPQTAQPTSMADVNKLAAGFRFPAVLKWKNPGAVAARLELAGLALLKAEYIYSSGQFLAAARRYQPIGQWPLLQEYCAGYGLGQFFYMHEGRSVRCFQHVRIAEWPPEGGFSSVCDAIALSEHEALQQKSIALLNAISWKGVAMVEYRMNPTTGQAVLMEINGRYWGSYPLAVQCHAGFALIDYYLHSNLGLPALPPVRNGLRCRMIATEVKRLVRICIRPELIVDQSFKIRKISEIRRFIADFFRPQVGYYVWSWTDPGPFFRDIKNLMHKLLIRS